MSANDKDEIWFNEVDDVLYTAVDYIREIGTLYTLTLTGTAYDEDGWKHHFQSLANFSESLIRTVDVVAGPVELRRVPVIHTMEDGITEADNRFTDLYFSSTTSAASTRVYIDRPGLEPPESPAHTHHIILAGVKENTQNHASALFDGKAKGLHHFAHAVFEGTLVHPKFAPAPGEKLRLVLGADGLVDGARCEFAWFWTKDYWRGVRRGEFTLGRIALQAGRPTQFRLSTRKGASWVGYDFWGTVENTNRIHAHIEAGDSTGSIPVVLKRVYLYGGR